MMLEYLARSRPAPEDDLERMADLWAARLAEVPTVLEIPSDRPRLYRYAASGEQLPVELSTRTTKSIFERSWTLNVTPLLSPRHARPDSKSIDRCQHFARGRAFAQSLR
jgi:hypothetical protein